MSAAETGAAMARAAAAAPQVNSLFIMDETPLGVFDSGWIFLMRSRTEAVANSQHRRKNYESLPGKGFDGCCAQSSIASASKRGTNVTLPCFRTENHSRAHQNR
jgi:hypothetical protein